MYGTNEIYRFSGFNNSEAREGLLCLVSVTYFLLPKYFHPKKKLIGR